MSVSTEVAVRLPLEVAPVRPLLAYAEASGNVHLMASAAELVAGVDAVQTAFKRLRLLGDAEETQRRADEASEALSLSQAAGTALPDHVEYLSGEAEAAWNLASVSWAKALAPGAAGAGVREYVGRRRVASKVQPLAEDWRDSIGMTDWSCGRDGAA